MSIPGRAGLPWLVPELTNLGVKFIPLVGFHLIHPPRVTPPNSVT